MPVRNGEASWDGTLQEGKGRFRVGSGAFEGAYSFGTRFEEEPGTNPEELIGAAHAACYSMALSGNITRAGYEPESIRTTAKVKLEKLDAGWEITRIDLATTVRAPGLGDEEFLQLADKTKAGCPVSKALAAVPIELTASLEG
jgi:osmotically inducible protein OsmC